MCNGVKTRLPAAALMFLVGSYTYGCAPATLPQRPTDNYKGPIAEGPILQSDDYWIYRRADGTRMKLGAGTLLSQIEFPLWLGKVWKSASTASKLGGPVTGRRTPVEIECVAAALESITVTAGTFEAFRCDCQCTVSGMIGVYDDNCGTWIVWYAPQAKNVVMLKTENTADSAELQEHKVSK